MKASAAFAGTFATLALGAAQPKNLIFIVPDGFGGSGQTLARTYVSLAEGESTPGAPSIKDLPGDLLPVGNVRTHSSNNLVTDSAAAGTALATGFKTQNGMIGVQPDGILVGNILEAAKLDGYHTAIVVTSTANHATPASFSAHITSRNDYDGIAAQQLGYSHPLNQSVDILMGGGRCYYKPKSDSGSCRGDDVDLIKFAQEKGYYVAQNRSQFDDLELGLGSIKLPFVGLFNDDQLSYEVDRKAQPEDAREPSLSEMTTAALNALDRATGSKKKGYFMLIEASRIDHAAHAHDSGAHLWDTLEYNQVLEIIKTWIDNHPDTAMMSVADHETGGLTLPSGYDPRRLRDVKQSAEHLKGLWDKYDGDDRRGFLVSEILPAYALSDATDDEIESILAGDFVDNLVKFLNDRIGVEWSTGGHTAVDTVLYSYGAGKVGDELKKTLAGHWDNTDIPRFMEKALQVSLDEVTELLRAA
ncbi:unnamed protein product [Clonostachys byssicola]|uniref:Alkaline phosphatase n=1 Tax=Clonostachys byssicola TaxID=160290 RepID=A0A9N9UFQ4_9HYPO|nr:unnamed protein product [Clonostachys byssicola]